MLRTRIFTHKQSTLRRTITSLENKISTEITFTHVASNDQLADIFTKPLGKTKFQRLEEKIGVRDLKWVQHICEL